MQAFLQDIAHIRSGYSFRGRIEAVPHGQYRVVQIKDVTEGAFVSSGNLVRTNLPGVQAHHYLQPGDVLFAARALRRTAVVVESVLPDTIFGAQFFVCTPRAGLEPAYLAWYLNQKPAQRYFEEHAAGTNMKIINKDVLERLPVTVPPVEKQRLIVAIYRLSRREQQLLAEIQTKRSQLIETVLLDSLERD